MGVVSLTSDVHFTAHVNMDPARAEGGFLEFKPLDEFVIGPIHAGSFGPNFMDTSFGAQYEFELGPLTQVSNNSVLICMLAISARSMHLTML